MARPKEFDRELALMSAVRTFWTHGYGGTSIQSLVDAMGIHRASLYDTFGSKQALFEEVLKRYTEHVFATVFAPLASGDRPLQRLHEFFEDLCDQLCGSLEQGCLVAKSALATDEDLAPLRALIAGHTERLETTFRALLERARDGGELPDDCDPAALARYLRNTFFGLTVSAAVERDAARLKEVARLALAPLGSFART